MVKITATNLKYRYPLAETMVLNDISFSVDAGDFIGIIGPNNSGKSTLCQALVGLVPQLYRGTYGGRVLIDGLDARLTPVGQLALKVGMVFQNPFTQISGAKMTVYEEIAFGLENLGVSRVEMIRRIDTVLDLMDIYPYKESNPFELSGGQMQRVAIAGVLAMEPDIIILDEPTSQLDPQGSEEVFRAVRVLQKKGMTIIMVEHKVEKIARYADRVMLLDNGRLVSFDTPARVFTTPGLEQYGVTAPVYTKICQSLHLKNSLTGLYPVTLDETIEIMVKRHA